MSSTALFEMCLKLGSDNEVDILPRRLDLPNLFVPFQYEYLSDTLRQYFPEAGVPGQGLRYEFSKEETRRWAEGTAPPSVDSYGDDTSTDSVVVGSKQKRPRGDDDDGVGKEEEGEEVQLECELVPSLVKGEDVLGLLSMGGEAVYYDTLAVVALLKPKITCPQAMGVANTTYVEKLIEAAYEQVDERGASCDEGSTTY
ncbi:hypothetical protein CBS101457_005295 [Exobasidium rhododendri]|nr:hypothetical protein CBS101457_005295 [Exobasidium rhododendri]